MEEIKITQYKAIDGTIFDDMKQCLEYENELEEKSKKAYLMQYVKELQSYCGGQENCGKCIFLSSEGDCFINCPADWEI